MVPAAPTVFRSYPQPALMLQSRLNSNWRAAHNGPENRVIMQAEELKDLVVNALEEVKAQDISVIDVRERTPA